jgi:hypothetical protein
MVSTPPEVEGLGAARRSGRPAAKEGRRGEHQRSSTVSTPQEVEAPGAAQMLGQPDAEEGRRGERQPTWPTGEAAGRRPPGTRPHLNGVGLGVKVPEKPSGQILDLIMMSHWHAEV